MPDLSTQIDIDMWRRYRSRRTLINCLRLAAEELFDPPIYGLEWGDPETAAPLAYVRDRYVVNHRNLERAIASNHGVFDAVVASVGIFAPSCSLIQSRLVPFIATFWKNSCLLS